MHYSSQRSDYYYNGSLSLQNYVKSFWQACRYDTDKLLLYPVGKTAKKRLSLLVY